MLLSIKRTVRYEYVVPSQYSIQALKHYGVYDSAFVYPT
jgi:hypothetical protein